MKRPFKRFEIKVMVAAAAVAVGNAPLALYGRPTPTAGREKQKCLPT
ncbi:MAG: hypothetical protein JSR86_16080 [Proteobacteria bacterium]|nr:hypothetical protein [Pseudomonadota bacterium]